MAEVGVVLEQRQYCTEINSIGLRCAHRATDGNKCHFHSPNVKRCTGVRDDGEKCEKMALRGKNVCAIHEKPSHTFAYDKIRQRPPKDIQVPYEATPQVIPQPFEPFADITNAEDFAKAVLESQEFREYVVTGLRNRDLPVTIILRLMDYAEGWGRPPERVEHTGKDGQPIVTEVRRVVVRASSPEEMSDGEETVSTLTH